MRNYVLIGAGGTGSFLFPSLLRYLEVHEPDQFRIIIIDGKEVAASKLYRQLFFGQYAGANKAIALREQYAADPNVVIAVPEYLKPDDMNKISDGDVVLIAADNFPVRARVEARARELDNITVINGGNEMIDGTCQIYMRLDGTDMTPPMSQGHPEMLVETNDDPALLSCQQIAELPGGEQTIIANMTSAVTMLAALRKVHEWEAADAERPHIGPRFTLPEEIYFDMDFLAMRATTRPTEAPT